MLPHMGHHPARIKGTPPGHPSHCTQKTTPHGLPPCMHTGAPHGHPFPYAQRLPRMGHLSRKLKLPCMGILPCTHQATPGGQFTPPGQPKATPHGYPPHTHEATPHGYLPCTAKATPPGPLPVHIKATPDGCSDHEATMPDKLTPCIMLPHLGLLPTNNVTPNGHFLTRTHKAIRILINDSVNS